MRIWFHGTEPSESSMDVFESSVLCIDRFDLCGGVVVSSIFLACVGAGLSACLGIGTVLLLLFLCD